MKKFYVVSTFLLSLSFLVLTNCESQDNTESLSETDCAVITSENADDCIRMNQIQVVGTHNSYKLYPVPDLVTIGNNIRDGWADNIMYEHRPLDIQLAELNVRQIELDIFADPEGGLFAEPAGALLSNDEPFIRPDEMLEPGFKTLHVQDTDYRSTCLTFKSCLEVIRDWSLDNPNHLPVLILVEMKDRTPDNWADFKFSEAIEIDEDLLHEADKEIWETFDKSHIITPDEARGHFETLEEAILTEGWPTLSQARGRVFFALDNTGIHKQRYLAGNPNLENRPMFVSSEPGEPTAGFIKMNNVLSDKEKILEYVSQGFIIRTRSDIPMREARSGDTTRREMALDSGAQYISTDYPEPSPFNPDFIVRIPGTDGPGRCNPISAPANCNHEWLKE